MLVGEVVVGGGEVLINVVCWRLKSGCVGFLYLFDFDVSLRVRLPLTCCHMILRATAVATHASSDPSVRVHTMFPCREADLT